MAGSKPNAVQKNWSPTSESQSRRIVDPCGNLQSRLSIADLRKGVLPIAGNKGSVKEEPLLEAHRAKACAADSIEIRFTVIVPMAAAKTDVIRKLVRKNRAA